MPDPPAQEKGGDAESPTTAQQFDFDDDTHDTTQTTGMKPKPATVEDESAPPKPQRPTSPNQQAENTLIEAFPNIDAKVVQAVLTASGGQLEPAFNALLGMSDPNFKPEEAAPPKPPRPTAAQRQLEQDEMYARQLAQHYQSSSRGAQGQERPQRQQRQESLYADDRGEDGRERSFFDDDLPEIQENIRKGFIETQSKVNSWITNFKKRLDGDDDNQDPYQGPTKLDPRPGQQQHDDYYAAHQGGSRTRRSGDYDADPRELGDDFTALELRDEDAPPPKPARPHANPDLFKPTPQPPQTGPVDEVEAFDRRATSPQGQAGQKKWQPLTSVAAQPEPEENDPFSVGDSDDEKESKTKDVREADTARLKEAARKSISEGSKPEGGGEGKGKVLEERKVSLSGKDEKAEELLAKK